MKKFLLIILIIILTGCTSTNNEENIKNEYIAMKSNLLEENITSKEQENLPLDITINLDRINEEIVEYKVTLNNPKENMNNIKCIIVHNYYSDEIFPSIGVFDKEQELLINSEENKEIELTGTIKTTKNISDMNLEIKLWLQYTNDSEEIKEIYYKTT